MLNTSFSPWPSFTKEEADAVASVVLSNKVNYWTGNECREFEKEFAVWTTEKIGGNGAVREICDLILHAQNKFEQALEGYFQS